MRWYEIVGEEKTPQEKSAEAQAKAADMAMKAVRRQKAQADLAKKRAAMNRVSHDVTKAVGRLSDL